MREFTILLIISGWIACCGGCASMCDASFDCDYHAFGGMRDRHDRTNGRVSSIFEPAAAQASVLPPVEQLPPYERPSLTTDDKTEDQQGSDGSENSDEEQLRKRLLDELEQLDDLPEIKDEEPTEI